MWKDLPNFHRASVSDERIYGIWVKREDISHIVFEGNNFATAMGKLCQLARPILMIAKGKARGLMVLASVVVFVARRRRGQVLKCEGCRQLIHAGQKVVMIPAVPRTGLKDHYYHARCFKGGDR
jgi:hypothetical protein